MCEDCFDAATLDGDPRIWDFYWHEDAGMDDPTWQEAEEWPSRPTDETGTRRRAPGSDPRQEGASHAAFADADGALQRTLRDIERQAEVRRDAEALEQELLEQQRQREAESHAAKEAATAARRQRRHAAWRKLKRRVTRR